MGDFDVLLHKAEDLLRQGKKDECKSLLNQVIGQDPVNARALHGLAQLAYADKEFERATELLHVLQKLHPETGRFYFDAGVIELQRDAFEAALDQFERARQIDPNQPEVLLHLALTLERLGRKYDAAMMYRKIWLKILRGGQDAKRLPPPMQQLLTHGVSLVRTEMKSIFGDVLAEIRSGFDNADLKRLEQLVRIIAGEIPPASRGPLQSPIGIHFPGLRQMPFLERKDFPWVGDVEAQAEAIRDEYLALSNDESLFRPYVSVDENAPNAAHWKGVNNSTDWNSCHLYHYGTLQEEPARRCPTTLAALNHAPLIRVPGHGPESIFSVLKPKTHIPPHHGLVSGRLLVHLPLIVPKNCGALRVGGEQRSWEFGKCLVFDDTYAHEAWNNSGQTRVVLIFDIWHPDLSEAEKAGFGKMVELLDKINVDSVGKAMLRE